MAGSRIAWGIDVGNRGLKAVRLVREGDGFRVDDFDIIEHETPLSQAGDNRDSLVSKSLAEFVSRHKTGSAPVGIAVSGQQSFAKFVKLPPVEEKEIPKIVRFEAIQQIPFPLDDVEWQYQLFRKADDPEVEVGIFAMRKELVNRIVGFYTDVNLNVQTVQTSPLAVYNALLFDGRLDGGTTLIIDMGAETTDLVIADGGQVWLRSLPIGGNNFTETLVRAFKIDFAKAEEMKRDASSSKYARQIFQAMRPVFADLVGEIQRSVGFYSSTHAGVKIKGAIVLGGTFKLPGLKKYLQQNLQMDVEEVKQFSAAGPTDPKTLAAYQENILSAVTAYGLAAQTMGEGKIESSLLPGFIRKERVWREKGKWFAAAAALFVAGAGIAFAGGYIPQLAYASASAEADRSHTQGILDQAQKLDTEWATVESGGDAERNLIKNIRTLETDRGLWPKIVATVRNSVPTVSDPASLKSKPRGSREYVKIDGWTSVFFHDIGPLLSDQKRARFIVDAPVIASAAGAEGQSGGFVGGPPPGSMPPGMTGPGFSNFRSPGMMFSGGGGGGGQASTELELTPPPAHVIAAATGKPGFLLRVTGVSPAKDIGDLLDRTVLTELLKTREGHEGVTHDFYIADAIVARQGRVADNPSRLQEMQRAHQQLQALKAGTVLPGSSGGISGMEGGGFEGGMPPGMRGPGYRPPVPPPMCGMMGNGMGAGNGPTASGEDASPYMDPATNEDMRQDMEFSLLVFVVLGSPPVTPAEATPAAAVAPAP